MRAYPRRTKAQTYVPPYAKGIGDGMGVEQLPRTLEDIEYSNLYLRVLVYIIALCICFLRDLLCCYGRLGLTVQACMCPSTSVQPSFLAIQHSQIPILHIKTLSRYRALWLQLRAQLGRRSMQCSCACNTLVELERHMHDSNELHVLWQTLLLPDASGDEAAEELLEWFKQEACTAPQPQSCRHVTCAFELKAAPWIQLTFGTAVRAGLA